jgi:hypothetical protein
VAVSTISVMRERYAVYYGWPFISCTRLVSRPLLWGEQPTARVVYFGVVPGMVSIVVLLSILISTWLVAHRLLGRSGRIQFRLSTLLNVMGAVCVVLTWLVHAESADPGGILSRWDPETDMYHPILLYPSWIYIPVLVGVVCALSTVPQALIVTGRRALHRMYHPSSDRRASRQTLPSRRTRADL